MELLKSNIPNDMFTTIWGLNIEKDVIAVFTHTLRISNFQDPELHLTLSNVKPC